MILFSCIPMANKTDIYCRFYFGDYLKDTMGLTTQEHGAYLLLLLAYYSQQKPLPADDSTLASITRSSAHQWAKLRPRMAQFFSINSETWCHKRCELEMAIASGDKSRRVLGANLTNAQKARKSKPQAGSFTDAERHAERHAQRPAQRDAERVAEGVAQASLYQESGFRSQDSGGGDERESAGARAVEVDGTGTPEPWPPVCPPMTAAAYFAGAELRGIPREQAEFWWNEWDGLNWTDRGGQPIRKPLSLLQNRWKKRQAQEAQERLREQRESAPLGISSEKNNPPPTAAQLKAAAAAYEQLKNDDR
jgi:uncharacterized protein YdaU (DUF1376 family)